jgi:hypothetical protein
MVRFMVSSPCTTDPFCLYSPVGGSMVPA